MTKKQATAYINSLNDSQLNELIDKCPPRVRLLVRSHMVDWRKTLLEWYMYFNN